MSLPRWNSKLATGLQQVDEEHQWLFSAIYDLDQAANQLIPNQRRVKELLIGLVDYADRHFRLEEEWFEKYQYPQSEEHLAEHARFRKVSKRLLDSLELGEPINRESIDFFNNWLTHHILEVDMAYVPYMKQHGIK